MCHHYRTRVLCRVSHSAKRTRSFFYRRSRLYLVTFLGHSANLCRVPSRTRQKKVETGRTTANWRTERANGTAERDGSKTLPSAICSALGKDSNFAECQPGRTRRSLGFCRVSGVWHSAKFGSLPSASILALGEV